MSMSDTCRHGRPLPCPYCAAYIRAADYWEMKRWLAELRRKGKRRAS